MQAIIERSCFDGREKKNEQPVIFPSTQSSCIAKKVLLLLLQYFWDSSTAVG